MDSVFTPAAADAFATVLGDGRGHETVEHDTVLAQHPSSRAHEDFQLLVKRLQAPRLARPEDALDALLTSRTLEGDRPLIKRLTAALARWAATDALTRAAPYVRLLAADTGVRDPILSEHVVRLNDSRPYLHLWVDGNRYGKPGLAPGITILCRRGKETDNHATLMPRGRWRAPSPGMTHDTYRCPSCADAIKRLNHPNAALKRMNLIDPSLLQNTPIAAPIKHIDGETRERGNHIPPLAYHTNNGLRRHLGNVIHDRLRSAPTLPADVDGLRQLASMDAWAQLRGSLSDSAHVSEGAVLDRLGLPVTPALRERLGAASLLTRDDWYQLTGKLLPTTDLTELADPTVLRSWLASSDSDKADRRDEYVAALAARVRTRRRA